ncbi:MAG: hypothetical protein FJZ63_07470 [Chlamydiae bacterium]|nr:hypothetical protein [Chlamydiota bacterium]
MSSYPVTHSKTPSNNFVKIDVERFDKFLKLVCQLRNLSLKDHYTEFFALHKDLTERYIDLFFVNPDIATLVHDILRKAVGLPPSAH